MKKLIYPSFDNAVYIHKKTIDYSGGGVYSRLDSGKLESVLEHIQNDDYYPLFTDKLTHLFWSVCKFHCFADGNKRLAITLCVALLLFNGYENIADKFFKSMEDISWNVAAGNISKDKLHKLIDEFWYSNVQNREINI